MARTSMDVTSFVGKLLKEDDSDILRDGIQELAQMIMEAEVSSKIGATPYERSESRTAYRNGYRSRTWDTRVGTVELRIPKVTAGTYFPSLLEPRKRAEKALQAVIIEAYVKGVSTRKVDDLVRALGIDGISKSEVSRICKALDTDVKAFLSRPIEGEHPYVWLDATFHKIREGGRVIQVATVVAVGVSEAGHRSVLGVETGPSEDHAFWTSFLRSLVRRGLKGVRLAISDAHEGLRQAIAKVLAGATWQRCRVHFMRNLLAFLNGFTFTMDNDLDFRNKVHGEAYVSRVLAKIADGLHINLLFLDFVAGLFLNGGRDILCCNGAIQFAHFARLGSKVQRQAIDAFGQVLEFRVEFRAADFSLRPDSFHLFKGTGGGKYGQALWNQIVAAIASSNLLHFASTAQFINVLDKHYFHSSSPFVL